MYLPICITQSVCVLVILITILIIKFFFEENFTVFQNWYKQNILDDTVVSSVFEEEISSEG